MTAWTEITGPCAGGCGVQVARPRVDGESAFAELANRVPLLCDACAQREQAEHDAELAAQQERQQRMQRRQRLEAAGIPAELQDVRLDALDRAGCEAALEHAHRWAQGRLRGLMLTGPFGTGKTTIAAGALRARLDRAPGRWASAPMLMARLGSGMGSRQREWALDLLSARHALVIDDLDKTRPTEYGAEQIFLAVDNSVTAGQALLVTTNLSAAQLAAKWPAPFGEAIVSRLAGYCTAITVTGDDRRLTGGAR